MVGFRPFKGLGRRKPATQENDDYRPPSSSTPQSFRVITREENNPKLAPVNNGNAWSLDRRSWVGSERDAGIMNRGNESGSPSTNSRYSVMDPSNSRFDPSNSDRRSMAHSPGPMSRAQISNRQFGKIRSQGFLDMPNGIEDDFGDDMFTGIGEDVKPIPPPPSVLKSGSESHMSKMGDWRTPEKSQSPLTYKRLDLNPSPYSADSRNSRDGLLSAPSSTDVSPSPKPLQPPNRFSRLPDSLMEDLDRLAPPPIVRRTESTESFTRSAPNEDADAAIVRKSVVFLQQQKDSRGPSPIDRRPIRSSLKPPAESPISSSDTSIKTQSMSSSSSLGMSEYDTKKKSPPISASTTPRPIQGPIPTIRTDPEDVPLAKIQPSARNRLSQAPLSRPSIAPVQSSSQSSSRESSYGDLSSSSGGSTIKAVRTSMIEAPKSTVTKVLMPTNTQRRESVISPDNTATQPPNAVAKRASRSSPNLRTTQPLLHSSDPSRRSSSDDDDDIPLAILQAHNFPSRGKTPDPRLSQSSSMLSLNQRTNTNGTPSIAGPKNSLPPFARKIPLAEDVFMDPMANRSSTMIRPPPGMSPVPGMPPGGLVGVIAEEERFRGIRRAGASPAPINPVMSMGMNGMGAMGMSIPGLGPGMGVGNYGMMDPNLVNQHAIMETLQAVQQQNAMLQQLFTMHIQPGGQSPMLMQDGSFGMVQSSPNLARPASVMSGSFAQQQMPMMGINNHSRTQSMVNISRPSFGSRTMSMVDISAPFPHQNAWETQSMAGGPILTNGLGLNYAPSVAPSERSNIGQPSRYRPVSGDGASNAGDAKQSGGLNMKGTGMGVRTSTYMAPTAANVEDAKKKKGVLNAVIHPKGKVGEGSVVNGDEAEEEEDWGTFARRRRQKG